MIREAGPEDHLAIEALLRQGIDGAMFPLSALRSYGLCRGAYPADHDRACRFWLLPDASLVAHSRAGMLMPLLRPGADLAGLRAALTGLTVTGAIGPATSVRPILQALGLDRLPMRRDTDEPGFALILADLILLDLPGTRLVPLDTALSPLVTGWRAAYQQELFDLPNDEARAQAATDVDVWIAKGSHRVLLHNGKPVALTGFNATLSEVVQVGGVYTLPALRGQGFARRAVALHLAEARASGVSRAVLFAAGPAAARAYRALGFRPTFAFALALLARPATIGA
jgi:GNAT superfamily N-acetyltransferase